MQDYFSADLKFYERPSRLIKLPEVLARTALSRSEIYRRIRSDPEFPKPMKLGIRSIAFCETEIDEFVRSRIAGRNAKVAA